MPQELTFAGCAISVGLSYFVLNANTGGVGVGLASRSQVETWRLRGPGLTPDPWLLSSRAHCRLRPSPLFPNMTPSRSVFFKLWSVSPGSSLEQYRSPGPAPAPDPGVSLPGGLLAVLGPTEFAAAQPGPWRLGVEGNAAQIPLFRRL